MIAKPGTGEVLWTLEAPPLPQIKCKKK